MTALPEVMPQMSQQVPFGRGMMQIVGQVLIHENRLSDGCSPQPTLAGGICAALQNTSVFSSSFVAHITVQVTTA